jgi:prevent-host-death family protein
LAREDDAVERIKLRLPGPGVTPLARSAEPSYVRSVKSTGQNMTDNLEYQASQAKAKWAELLDEVERGRTVRITRHGKTIARVVPETDGRAAEIAEAIERLKALREKTRKAPLAEILASRHEGHKY